MFNRDPLITHRVKLGRVRRVRFRIDVLDNCTGCGICWILCPKGVLYGKLKERAVVLNEDICMGCYSCQDNCPYGAIRVMVIT